MPHTACHSLPQLAAACRSLYSLYSPYLQPALIEGGTDFSQSVSSSYEGW